MDPDTICNKAGHQALEYVFGTSLTGFDPRTAKDTSCILVWGANPSASAPHVHKHWLAEAPGKIIVIDPIAHPTTRIADLFLQIRPGSDAALAFAMLNVIRRQELVAEDFLRDHVVGWEEVDPLISACTPQWGERQTDVPAAKIEAAAEIYARGPSLMWLGQGMQRQPLGGNAFRAAAMLCAATGNIGKLGAGILYLNGANTRGIEDDYLPAPHLGSGEKASIGHMDLAETLGDARKSRALLCWNNNIVASNPDPARNGQPKPRYAPIIFDGTSMETAIYRRVELAAGTVVGGPALVTQADSTCFVEPGYQASVHDTGVLILEARP